MCGDAVAWPWPLESRARRIARRFSSSIFWGLFLVVFFVAAPYGSVDARVRTWTSNKPRTATELSATTTTTRPAVLWPFPKRPKKKRVRCTKNTPKIHNTVTEHQNISVLGHLLHRPGPRSFSNRSTLHSSCTTGSRVTSAKTKLHLVAT